MKLPFTEKFLWDLYKVIYGDPEKISKPFFERSLSEYLYSDYYHLIRQYEAKKDKQRFQKLIHYLKKKGWIEPKEFKDKKAVLITAKGRERVLKIMRKRGLFPYKKRKDGKWQMIMYDIPENKKYKRETFRENLKLLGFEMIQKSIWVSPYDITKDLRILIDENKLEDHVRLLLVEEIEI